MKTLAILFLLASSLHGQSLIHHTAASGTSTFTTSAIDTTGAKLIYAAAYANTAGGPAFSDSAGNTGWVLLGPVTSGGQEMLAWFKINPTTSASHTFTLTAASGNIFASLTVEAFGSATFVIDTAQGGSTSSNYPFQCGSMAIAQNGELIFASVGYFTSGWSGTLAISGDGFSTITDELAMNPGNWFGASSSYIVQGTAAAVNPTWTSSDAVSSSACINSAFKATPTTTTPIRHHAVSQ
jgi:hypothetical protein